MMLQDKNKPTFRPRVFPMSFKCFHKKEREWEGIEKLVLKDGCLGLIFIQDIEKIKVKSEQGVKGTFILKVNIK